MPTQSHRLITGITSVDPPNPTTPDHPTPDTR